MDLQNCRIEGWLKVCEFSVERILKGVSIRQLANEIKWHSGYVVVRQDDCSLMCYKNEQVANRVGRNLRRLRLDGGYKSFYRKWGYPTPPPPPARPFVIVEQQMDDDNDECCSSDEFCDTVSLRETAVKTTTFAKSHTSYDLIDSPTIESRSLDRRRGWTASSNRVMPALLPSTNFGEEDENSLAMVESASASHKLANFLSRPFRNNPLKRTKSVSKLDRKRSALDPQSCVNNWPHSSSATTTPALNNLRSGATIRNSHSHDSLLSYSTTTHAIDLTTAANNGHSRVTATVTPLHASVLGTPHCFRINTATDAGSAKYYACRSSAERDRWIECLNKTMHPYQNQTRRQENSLQLWIFAAKGIPSKRRYYCEVCLDQILYSRTTSKFKAKDECFWGEQFEINHLPKLESVCVNLYKEADRKKKKDRNTLVGYVQIPASLLTARHPVEKWYSVHGTEKSSLKGELASLRVKARFQTTTILPLHVYDDFLLYLKNDYLVLCSAVENLTSVKSKEDVATCLVRVLHKEHMAKDFLCDLVMCEVDALDNYHLMFRGNSLATKAMEAYMKLVGEQYLHQTLSEFIQTVIDANDDCEVDPSKLSNISLLSKHQELLMTKVHLAWGKIVNSFYDFPAELRQVFNELRRRLDVCGRQELCDYLISSNIFLRFLCPAILSPSLFNLVQEYPNEKTVRTLTLVAKTIQTLANFTKFGVKEQYMEFMNKFVEGEWDHMRQFLLRISSSSFPNSSVAYHEHGDLDGCIDAANEMSLLHLYLTESWPSVEEKNRSLNLVDLKRILDRMSECLQNPSSDDVHAVMSGCENNSDNSHLSSPASPVSDYENHAVDFHVVESSTTDDGSPPVRHQRFGSLIKASIGPQTISSPYKSPANSLNTDDDYVWYTAINENLGLRRTGMVVQQNRQKLHVGNPAANHEPLTQCGNSSSLETFGCEFSGELRDVLNERNKEDRLRPSMIIDHHGSQGSLNYPPSSGYQSQNYSTSNSSSPVEVDINCTNSLPNRKHRPLKEPIPLSIANPIYSMQIVPSFGQEQSNSTLSLPNIDEANIAPGVFGQNAATQIVGTSNATAGQLYTPQSRRSIVGNKMALCQQNSLPRMRNDTADGLSYWSSSASSTGESSPLVNNIRSIGLPRTNPRFVNGLNFLSRQRSTPKPSSESHSPIAVGYQQTPLKRQSLFSSHTHSVPSVSSRESLSSSNQHMPEAVKPILDRLRLVEAELVEEHNSSAKKQQIIDVQQKRIETLQSVNAKLLNQLKQAKSNETLTKQIALLAENENNQPRKMLTYNSETNLIVERAFGSGYNSEAVQAVRKTQSEPTSPLKVPCYKNSSPALSSNVANDNKYARACDREGFVKI